MLSVVGTLAPRGGASVRESKTRPTGNGNTDTRTPCLRLLFSCRPMLLPIYIVTEGTIVIVKGL